MQISIALIGLCLLVSASSASPVGSTSVAKLETPSGAPAPPLSRRVDAPSPADQSKDKNSNNVEDVKKAVEAQAKATKTEFRNFADEQEKLAKKVGALQHAKLESMNKMNKRQRLAPPVTVVVQTPPGGDKKGTSSEVESARKAVQSSATIAKNDFRKLVDDTEKLGQAKANMRGPSPPKPSEKPKPNNNKKEDPKKDSSSSSSSDKPKPKDSKKQDPKDSKDSKKDSKDSKKDEDSKKDFKDSKKEEDSKKDSKDKDSKKDDTKDSKKDSKDK